MKETIIKCDGCGTAAKVVQYRIDCGTEMDPSGNGYETYWEYKDYCLMCLVDWINSNPEKAKKIQSM